MVFVQVVHPSWLWVAYQNWERQKEENYPLSETHQGKDEAELIKLSPGPNSKRNRPALIPSPTLSLNMLMSQDDISEMDKEVEEILSSEEDDEQDEAMGHNNSDDEKTGIFYYSFYI